MDNEMGDIPPPSKTHHTPIQSMTEIIERDTSLFSPSQRFKSSTQVTETTEDDVPEKPARKWRRVKRKKHFTAPTQIGRIEGVHRITISPWVQKVLHCLVGEDITGEYPWKYIKKEDLEDNIELHEESSEFLPFKEDILVFPREEMLVIYIPDEQRDYDEFYICLTEAAEEGALVIINRILEEREERLNNSVLKNIGEWKTLGSESAVKDIQTDNNNRPLFEVEIETDYPVRTTKICFKFRMSEQAQDGYAEIMSTRRTFVNVERKRQDIGVQVSPTTIVRGSQTEYYFSNANTQYEFAFPELGEPGKEFKKNLTKFLDNDMDQFEELLYMNEHIDLYKDDYVDLVRDEKYTVEPHSIYYKQYASFFHPITTKGKEIVCHSWHPMWSGIVAIGYGKYKHSDYRSCDRNEDLVNDVVHNTVPVLLWSLKNILTPSLYLETSRAVTCLFWCPYDENILVGGCDNGQIIVWDLTDKLETAEREEILTVEQTGYRKYLKKFMAWMKYTNDLTRVLPTIVSDQVYSHKAPVTSIKWITRFREVTKSGQIKDIPEEEERGSLQFISGALDGTLLIWDMLLTPTGYTSAGRVHRKSHRLERRPSALTVTVSQYRYLNRIFRPIYKVNVMYPNSSRTLPLTELHIRVAKTEYFEKHPDPTRNFKITDRRMYYPICHQATFPCRNELAVGSIEGDFLILSWDGFDYNSGEIVNKENCKIDNMARYHDGPVCSISRSEVFPDLILTTGGKIFAIWDAKFKEKPVLWRKSKCRYTYGAWNVFRPSTFRLCRVDGFVEIWHLRTRSDRCTTAQYISKTGLGQITHHLRAMKQNLVGMVGSKGSFELFYLSHNLSLATEEDKYSTYKICERERNRKENFIKWQAEWLKKHESEIKERQEQARILKLEKEEARKLEREQKLAEKEEEKEQSEAEGEAEPGPPPGHYAEWAEQKQRERDRNRMMEQILHQKKLNLTELRQNEKPLHAIAAEHHQKQIKLEKRQNIAERMFDESVAMLFPDSIEIQPPPPPDPYAGGDTHEAKMLLFENYTQASEGYLNYLKDKEYRYHFNWLNVLQSGKERRRSGEAYTNRYSHKLRFFREKLTKRSEGVDTTDEKYKEPSRTSLESIDYGIDPGDTFTETEENEEA